MPITFTFNIVFLFMYQILIHSKIGIPLDFLIFVLTTASVNFFFHIFFHSIILEVKLIL